MSTAPAKPRAKYGTSPTLHVDLGSSSLKADLVATGKRAGFRGVTDLMITVVRDLARGRIQYSERELVSQG